MQNQRRLVADCKHRSLGKAVSVPFPGIRWPKVTAPHVQERNAPFAYSEEVIWWRPSHNSLLWESTCEAGLCLPRCFEKQPCNCDLRSGHNIVSYNYIYNMPAHMWNLILYRKWTFFLNETDTDKHGYQRGKWGWVRGKSGAWHKHLHPTIHKRDNQQGPTVWHRELYSIFCDKLDEKSIWNA